MKNEIKYTLSLLALGASLVAYAHTTFATKAEVQSLIKIVERIDERVYDIHSKLHKNGGRNE